MKLSKLGKELKDRGYKIMFSVIDDDTDFTNMDYDISVVEHIRSQISKGNEASWFLANVSLEYCGLISETEYLGGCSYNSLDEFTSTDNCYFDQMLKDCHLDIDRKIKRIKSL
jgi:hypothetical protein